MREDTDVVDQAQQGQDRIAMGRIETQPFSARLLSSSITTRFRHHNVSVLQRLRGEIGRTSSDVQKRDGQADKQTDKKLNVFGHPGGW